MHNVCAFRHDLGFNWQPAENSRRCAVDTDAFYTSRELNTLVIRLAEFKKQIEELDIKLLGVAGAV
jgi:hypothetical protein